MDILVSKYGGFCQGVRRADNEVRRLAALGGEHIVFTIGQLIHNEHYNDELRRIGVLPIEIEDVPDILSKNPEKKITLVIRTHGITKQGFERLEQLCRENENLSVVDLTCPSVKKIRNIAEEYTSDKTHFVFFATADHPEVVGIMSFVKGDKTVVSSLEELEALKIDDKIPILCAQTTQNLLLFVKIKNFFKKRFTNAQIFDTICSVTENRQSEATAMARECDMMIVIGGLESSNTKKLYELCSRECKNTSWIQALDCPPIAIPGDVKKVGITAGASTPDGIILEVYKSYGKL